MKYFLSFLIVLLVSFSLIPTFSNIDDVSAGWIIFSNNNTKIPYCNSDEECGLENGIDHINDIKTLSKKTASEFIQDIIVYILGFLQLLAVIILIYSGVILLTGVGDEDKAKNTKQIILYTIMGLIIIWLAYPITVFIFTILDQ